MAYTGAMTLDNLGDGDYQINVVETDVAVGDEPAGLTVPFHKYTLLRIVSEKSAGAAATLQPVVGRTTDPATAVEAVTTAAAVVDEQPVRPTKCRTGADGKIYWRTRPDAGADNAVTSFMRVREGWDEDE